jgi:hypothetical protein
MKIKNCTNVSYIYFFMFKIYNQWILNIDQMFNFFF